MSNNIKYWKTQFEKLGIKENLQTDYLEYITVLNNNDLPIIFDLKHLAKLLGRSSRFLVAAINSNTSFYRTFKIPKRRGGTREITAPYPSLLECQIWIYENVLKKVKVHFSAQAYCKSKSIKTNAQIHLGEECLVKLDLKDFFTSIKINRIIYLFKRLGYTHSVSYYLARLCCYEDYLPQGAPTSPAISNIITYKMDLRLYKLARSLKLKYSRYADDIVISGKKIPRTFTDYFLRIIADEGFNLNNEKTRFSSVGERKIITGISITNGELKIPIKYKRNIRQEIHFIRKYGFYSHISKLKIQNTYYLESLLGKIAFWKSIEPDNKFAIEAYQLINNLKKEFQS